MENLDLDAIRSRIDKLDAQLVALLEERMEAVLEVAAYKKQHGLPVLDATREAQVIAKACGRLQHQEYSAAVTATLQTIMDQSKALEHVLLAKAAPQAALAELEVGCFGMPGSYSHQALEKYFAGRQINRHHYALFEDVVQAVKKGEIKYGVLPIENSSTGGITEVYDLLRHYDCSIVGEQCVKIEHNLLGVPGARLEDITTVYSHPQGFAQSKEFFQQYPQMELVPYFSTSKSAETVRDKQDRHLAAVAGSQAAEMYGLQILAANINYNSNNYTRFIVIANEAEQAANANKITVVVAVKHEAGSLYRTLGHFYHSGLNMMNLESRPIEGKSWEYFFHIDLVGNLREERVRQALAQLSDSCAYCKILGNYPADGR